MEKVIRTFSASMSEETVQVIVNGATTDVIVRQVISDNDNDGKVVSNQTTRKSIPTVDAWAIIQSASGK